MIDKLSQNARVVLYRLQSARGNARDSVLREPGGPSRPDRAGECEPRPGARRTDRHHAQTSALDRRRAREPRREPVGEGSCAVNQEREAREVFQLGDVVSLPDGGVASVQQVIGSDVYVIEWTKRVGRGPWIHAYPVNAQ